MFNRLEVRVLPPGPRWGAELRFWIDGEDVVAGGVGEGGRGPLADAILAAGDRDPLWATAEGHRAVLGEPECTGGCCGYLTVLVMRHGGIVEWSDWQVPADGVCPATFHFDADDYDAELSRLPRLVSEVRRQSPA